MVQIKNEGPRLKLAGKVVLERGLNEVESERWKACVGHQMTQVFLGTGMIRVVSGVGSPARLEGEPEPDLPTTLKAEPETVPTPDTNADREEEIPIVDLLAEVEASTDVAHLRDLVRYEMRTDVKTAIQARVDFLVPEPTMSAKDAIARVKVCGDQNHLERLLEIEHRTTVRAAVSPRLDSLPF